MAGFPSEGRLRKNNQNPASKPKPKTSSKIKDGMLFGGFTGQAKVRMTGSLKLLAASRMRASTVTESGYSNGGHPTGLATMPLSFCSSTEAVTATSSQLEM